MQLSIIVPIYNGEKYLRDCVNSILSQTFQDFELILVDDGSTDASEQICNQYAQKDKRVAVFHKDKEGVTIARRTGLINAKGDYIVFVDADDWIEEDFCESLVKEMQQNQADVVMTGCIKEHLHKQEIVTNNIPDGLYAHDTLRQKIFPYMLHYLGFYQFGILPYLWNKLYKKELLLQCFNDIDTKIYDGEDVAIVFTYLLKTNRIVVTSMTKYHYRMHSGSVTANKRADYYQNCCYLYLYLDSEFKKTDFYEFLRPQLDQFMRKMIWQVKPGSFPQTQDYVFPFNRIPQNARIILYGAGNVGKIYYHQIQKTEYCDIAVWVDRAYQTSELQRLGIKEPNRIKHEKYDFVIIAIADNKQIVEVIKTIKEMGVSEEKIIY